MNELAPLLTPVDSADELLTNWKWLVPSGYVPIYATRFGDLFLRGPDGKVFFLNTLDAELIEASQDDGELLAQLREPSIQDDVLMPKLVSQLVGRFGEPSPGECFSTIIPPTIGGKLELKNFHVLSLAMHLSALGKIQAQVANDPPGTKYSVCCE